MKNIFAFFCLLLVIASCAPSSTPAPVAISPTFTITPAPSLTPLPAAITPSPTLILPTPTATLVPHPLMIDVMRSRPYDGSAITIERTLAPASYYSRYYVSYLSDGLKIYALLTVPYGDPPETGFPVIIFNHGYIPPDQYRTTERYVDYVDRLASAGYIVLRSDYRGHDQSEGEARGGYGYPDYTIDILNAIGSIKQYPLADPNRIGMWGHSMGGYITLRSMVISKDIKAGVIWAGVVGTYEDMLYRWRRPTANATPIPNQWRRWREELVNIYGPPETNPLFWDSISSNTYVSDISGPVQLHHGTDDGDVPLQFSTTLYQNLITAGKEVEFYVYEGDNHNISINFTTAMNRTIEFLDRYLK